MAHQDLAPPRHPLSFNHAAFEMLSIKNHNQMTVTRE